MKQEKRFWIWLVALPAILLAVIVKIVPLVNTWNLAFRDYRMTGGSLYSAPWVGFRNFQQLYIQFPLLSAVANSIVVQLCGSVLGTVLGAALAVLLLQVNNQLVRRVLCAVFSLGWFLPALVLYGWVSSAGEWLWMLITRPVVICSALVAVRGFPVAMFLALAIAGRAVWLGRNPVTGAWSGAAIWGLLSLAQALNNHFTLYRVFLPESVPNLSYWVGYANLLTGPASALDFTRFWMVLIALGTVAALIYYRLFGSWHGASVAREEKRQAPLLLLPVGIVLAGVGLICTSVLSAEKGFSLHGIVLYGMCAVLCGGITLLMSAPLVQGGRVHILYLIFLFICMAAPAGTFGEYEWMRVLGVINSDMAILLTGAVNIPAVITLGLLIGMDKRENIDAGRYFATAWRPAVGIACLQFLRMWSDHSLPELLYRTTLWPVTPSSGMVWSMLQNREMEPLALMPLALIGMGLFLAASPFLEDGLWGGAL